MNTPPAFFLSPTAFDIARKAEKNPKHKDTLMLVIPVIAFGRDEVEAQSGKMTDDEWADYLDMERTPFSA